jgi:hypothetical protein
LAARLLAAGSLSNQKALLAGILSPDLISGREYVARIIDPNG